MSQAAIGDRVEGLLERRAREGLGEDPQVHQTPPLTSSNRTSSPVSAERDGDHRLHGGQSVIEARPRLGSSIEDRGREALYLKLVSVRILPEHAVELAIAR